MRTRLLKLGLLAGSSAIAVASLGPAVLARDGSDRTIRPANRIETSSTHEGSNVTTPPSPDRQKACQVHEHVINATMQRIAARGARHIDVFDKIATRVETFANTKGQKPSNYDALVADVNAKKAAAQATVDKVKSDSASFKCDGSDPKGAASGFKADLKAEIAALKAYKTSVKNLIVAVKSANQTSSPTTTGGSQQ
jgi:hypothetical protein